MRRFFEIIKNMDWLLFATVCILVILGLVLIYSTTTTEEARWSTEFIKQLVAFGIGVILIFVLAIVDYNTFKNYAYVLYAFLIILLIAVLFLGQEVRGTRGWFDLGIFQFQPSELGKVILLIILSRYFASVSGRVSRFQFVLVSGLITAIPFTLVMFQPDLGSALVYIAIWIGLLLFSGIKKIYAFFLFVSGAALTVFAWLFFLKDYQKQRIISFLNPASDPLGAGYNIIQSKIAVGSGGFFGQGLGHGTQSQLRFLPERHTDFIFAVLTEELGFLGGIIMLLVFFVIFWRIISIGRHSRDEFGIMLVIGAVVMFVFQIFVNIGMNLGIMPITGIPLVLVSYGGSALVMTLIVIGIIQSIKVRGRKDQEHIVE
ncbi:rod shape-determining protein RodA [Patescibacteria group bacterium]|nr:rod shape-determining protein RodA [Patescibacteria group bacterium]